MAKNWAAALGLGVSAVALGPGAGAAASELAAAGADTVYVSEDAAFEGWPADAVAAGLAQIAEQAGASVVLVGSTRRGKETAPRLAQKLGAGCVTDVNEPGGRGRRARRRPLRLRRRHRGAREGHDAGQGVRRDAQDVQRRGRERPGRALVQTPTPRRQVERQGRRPARQGRRPRESRRGAADRRRRPRLQRPRGPRPRRRARAAPWAPSSGCTKSLADFEWLGEDRIIGLSGAKTAPDLYLSVGVSGQIQHTVGVAGAKLIAAVNKDKEAPIFAHGRLRPGRRPLRGGAGARRASQERVTRAPAGASRPPARLAFGRPPASRQAAPAERDGSAGAPRAGAALAAPALHVRYPPTVGPDDGRLRGMTDAPTAKRRRCRSPATATAAAAARCWRPSRAVASRASATIPAGGPYLKGCVRGYQAWRQQQAPERLTTPLVRTGPRGSGQFREATLAGGHRSRRRRPRGRAREARRRRHPRPGRLGLVPRRPAPHRRPDGPLPEPHRRARRADSTRTAPPRPGTRSRWCWARSGPASTRRRCSTRG